MSLLLSEGHFHARQYPLKFLWNEVVIVRQRLAASVKLDAIIQQSILATVLGGKKAHEALRDILAGLDDGNH